MSGGGGIVLLELRAAMERPGCPVCRSALRREERYLVSLLHENVNDPSVRRRLLDALGFCPRHLWLMTRIERALAGDSAGSTILLEAFLDEWERRVREHLSAGPDRAASTRLDPGAGCRACSTVRDGSRLELREVVRLIDGGSAELARDYERSDGLCIPHVAELLRETAGPTRDAMVARARRTADELRAQLRTYDRLRAWDTRDEPRGIEQTAWLRAAAFLAGTFDDLAADARDVPWPRDEPGARDPAVSTQ